MVPEIVGMAEAARTSGHVPSASPRDWASRKAAAPAGSANRRLAELL